MARKKRNEEEIAATVAELPTRPPEGTVDELKRRGFLDADILLYRAGRCYIPLEERDRKMVLVHCTACGEETYLEHKMIEHGCHSAMTTDSFGFIDPFDNETKVSGSTCHCPNCQKGMKAVHISRFRSQYEISRQFCMTVHNIRGHLVLLSWTIAKTVDKDGFVMYIANMWEGVLIIGGFLVRVVGYVRNMSAVIFYGHWVVRKKGEDAIGACHYDEIIEPSAQLVESTDAANAAFYEYLVSSRKKRDKIHPGKYLQTWVRHPNVENLVRQGFVQYINQVLDKCTHTYGSYYCRDNFLLSETEKYVNWKEVKPHKMLRLEKQDMDIAKKYKIDTVAFYIAIKEKYGIRLEKDTLKIAENFGIYGIEELLKNGSNGYRVPIVRMLHYLNRQKTMLSATRSKLIEIYYLKDYWDAIYKVYGRMEQSVLYPKNLISAHDNMVLRVKEKEDAELNAKIADRLEALEALSYRNEELGLLIRPAASHSELIKEGKILHHCVGGYAKSHAQGMTSIYFIRHIATPDIPFFTLEYKDGKVRQNRGAHNCERTPEVIAFEAAWLEHIKEVEVKKEKEYAKRNRSRQQECAGA